MELLFHLRIVCLFVCFKALGPIFARPNYGKHSIRVRTLAMQPTKFEFHLYDPITDNCNVVFFSEGFKCILTNLIRNQQRKQKTGT